MKGMDRTDLLPRLAILLVLCAFTGCKSKLVSPSSPLLAPRSGIEQVLETRGGEFSVWGMVINVSNRRFGPVVRDDELEIHDDKYPDKDMKPMMTWSVENDGHSLRIVFKPGDGDFGSGNHVFVRIKSAAIVGQVDDRSYEWEIPTDPL
jgi:hypothetical protein